jgi:Ca-activated chloride channel homolog
LQQWKTILLCLLCPQCLLAQYYIRGEIKDEKNNLLPNARIVMHSNRYLYVAGSSGTFGLVTSKPAVDTFTISYEGYETVTLPVFTSKYNEVKLKMLASLANSQKKRLSSITKDLKNGYSRSLFSSNETYSELIENDFVAADKYPVTGFSVNTDRASYSNIRRFINMKSEVPHNAVRVDEMINYFNFSYNEPEPGKTFKVTSQLTQCPWNTSNLLLYVNISARKINLEQLPPSNLVFLVDNSGSMELQNRMPLLKSAFRMLVKNLRDKDTIAIVTYGGMVQVALPPISGRYKDSIIRVIEEMEPAGDTPGESAIRLAYNVAKHNYNANGNNRVILATDGDFNVGIANEDELEKFITLQRKSGIYLTCLGVGMGNYKDSKLEVLARKGDGNFAYLDTEAEAEKTLVKEMSRTLYTVADKVFMNMRFDSDFVKRYRLLGFDNKKNAIADETSLLEGGEVGSGYCTNVLFEIEPGEHISLDHMETVLGQDIGRVLIHYNNPGDSTKQECNYNCAVNYNKFETLHPDLKFTAAIAMFGSYLKKSPYMKSVSLKQIGDMVAALPHNNDLLQQEFGTIVAKAVNIYEPARKKKKKAGKPEDP